MKASRVFGTNIENHRLRLQKAAKGKDLVKPVIKSPAAAKEKYTAAPPPPPPPRDVDQELQSSCWGCGFLALDDTLSERGSDDEGIDDEALKAHDAATLKAGFASLRAAQADLTSLRAENTELLQAVANANAKCVAAAARSTTLRLDVARAEVRAADAEAQQDKARVKQAAAEAWARKANACVEAHKAMLADAEKRASEATQGWEAKADKLRKFAGFAGYQKQLRHAAEVKDLRAANEALKATNAELTVTLAKETSKAARLQKILGGFYKKANGKGKKGGKK